MTSLAGSSLGLLNFWTAVSPPNACRGHSSAQYILFSWNPQGQGRVLKVVCSFNCRVVGSLRDNLHLFVQPSVFPTSDVVVSLPRTDGEAVWCSFLRDGSDRAPGSRVVSRWPSPGPAREPTRTNLRARYEHATTVVVATTSHAVACHFQSGWDSLTIQFCKCATTVISRHCT